MELGSANMVAKEFIDTYGRDIVSLSAYIPYFKTKRKASDVASEYDGKYGKSNLKFPVFDETLMTFVKKASASSLMDRNYHYVYSRYHIRTHDDERRVIDRAGLTDVKLLKGFISKYVLEGMHKGTSWQEGTSEGIFLGVLEKLKYLYDFYKPRE